MKVVFRVAMICLALIALGFGYLRSQPLEVVPLGTPVRQDDFTYAVTRVVTKRSGDTITYDVTINVKNDAKRVDYQWSDNTAYVVDSAGRRYRAATSQIDRAPIPPGASASFVLTFSVPADAKTPMLRYWNGILMGDVFDGVAYARTAVAL